MLQCVGLGHSCPDLHSRFVATADAGGGWVRYSWRNHASEPLYEKIALVVPVTSPSGSSYYIGVGMRNRIAPSAPGPLGQPCSPGYNYPCSLRDTMSVSSHTLAHILSSSESAVDTFAAIDNSFTLGDTNGDANGFYVFIYDYNDTCVLHVASPRFVGMDLGSVFRNVSMRANGTDLHLLFRRAAERGGGWVSAAGSLCAFSRGSKKLAQVTYPWKKVEEGMASNSEEFTKVTYIFHFNLHGRYE